jgi:hypothetical protein
MNASTRRVRMSATSRLALLAFLPGSPKISNFQLFAHRLDALDDLGGIGGGGQLPGDDGDQVGRAPAQHACRRGRRMNRHGCIRLTLGPICAAPMKRSSCSGGNRPADEMAHVAPVADGPVHGGHFRR